ncbi:MAG: SIR2 family protein [Candidatus Eisenbacteria bacterium]|nr:SIR2 family protein [Candidatus Eisenbacteria bacterium]
MKVVLFLGAGFSAAFGLPVMNEFLSFANASPRLTPEQKKFLDALTLEARGANSFLQSRPTNLEDILSFALMKERLTPAQGSPESPGELMKMILHRIYTQIPLGSKYWSGYEVFKKFLNLDLQQSPHSLCFVTTNYDLNIECALSQMFVFANPGFNFAAGRAQRSGNFYTPKGIPVFKLHGSVNWFERAGEPDTVDVEEGMTSIRWMVGNTAETGPIPVVCSQNYVVPGSPVIVAPSFLKPNLRGPMGQVWTGARKVLGEADMLVFVGYSFPQSDTEMKYFLATALVDNPRLSRIVIVDPEADAIARRLRDENSKYGSHFRELLFESKFGWTDGVISHDTRSVVKM